MNQQKMSSENLTPLVKGRIKNAVARARNLPSDKSDSDFMIALMKVRSNLIKELNNDYLVVKRKAVFYKRIGLISSLIATAFWLFYVILQIQNLVGTTSINPLIMPLVLFVLLPLPMVSGYILAAKQKYKFGLGKADDIVQQATAVFDYTLVKGWISQDS